jgi:hypothetical protein
MPDCCGVIATDDECEYLPMRKLIHIHGLLAVTREHLAGQDETEIPTDAFDAYDDCGVGPTAIAKRKDAHKEAVEYLLDGIHTVLTTQQMDANAPTPSSEPIDTSTAQSS